MKMAKRGYKLQEFVAHSAGVNCLNIGKKARRLLLTGGEDHKVILWAIGKPTSLMSLCGHTSPVEAVVFDSAETLVLGGASTGAVKLWDLEETKMVRTITGHRSNCTAVEFHPFGEFFASGSLDTNLKIWDIRKKECIHTYKGHTGGVGTIRFTPDGRWVVSGGFDNVVKIWDLTAGKLLHDFKSHQGPIQSITFHPLEFLLATGSADRTVKFWDLETFELIGTTTPEPTGVRSIAFHPDGRNLFCGLDDGLKVYSWEPVICHDGVDMGWSSLGDLCIHEGKLLGCSYYRNSVGVWVTDVSLMEPYRSRVAPEQADSARLKFNQPESQYQEKLKSGSMSAGLNCTSPEHETIKNIYVDFLGEKPVGLDKNGSLKSSNIAVPLEDSKEISCLPTQTYSSTVNAPVKSTGLVTYERPDGFQKDRSMTSPNREVSMDSKEISGLPTKSPAVYTSAKSTMQMADEKPFGLKRDVSVKSLKFVVALDSNEINCIPIQKQSPIDTSAKILGHSIDEKPVGLQSDRFLKSRNTLDSLDSKEISSMITQKIDTPAKSTGHVNVEKTVGLQKDEPLKSPKGAIPLDSKEISSLPLQKRSPAAATSAKSLRQVTGEKTVGFQRDVSSKSSKMTVPLDSTEISNRSTKKRSSAVGKSVKLPGKLVNKSFVVPTIVPRDISDGKYSTNSRRESITKSRIDIGVLPKPTYMRRSSKMKCGVDKMPITIEPQELFSNVMSDFDSVNSEFHTRVAVENEAKECSEENHSDEAIVAKKFDKILSPETKSCQKGCIESFNCNNGLRLDTPINGVVQGRTRSLVEKFERKENFTTEDQATFRSSSMMNGEPQISEKGVPSPNNDYITEEIMQTHGVFLRTLNSRLTKLQVMRHFWERNDIKGAIVAMKKFDHSVQVDIIDVLMEKMEIFTLDLFSCLLPALSSLLDSNMERHANISLEMLLKLTAVFGQVVQSTVSAPRGVGVDLQAEHRLECCKECSVQLHKVQNMLPILIKRGGVLAKSALELKLVLQDL